MKQKIILSIIFNLSLFFSTHAQYDFGHLSYTNERPTLSPDYYRIQAEIEAIRLQQRKIEFEEKCGKAFDCFNLKDYEGCIFYYNQSKKLGWYNYSFDYIVGLSYYYTGDKKKAKKYLKLSSNRGCYDAEKKIREFFP